MEAQNLCRFWASWTSWVSYNSFQYYIEPYYSVPGKTLLTTSSKELRNQNA